MPCLTSLAFAKQLKWFCLPYRGRLYRIERVVTASGAACAFAHAADGKPFCVTFELPEDGKPVVGDGGIPLMFNTGRAVRREGLKLLPYDWIH